MKKRYRAAILAIAIAALLIAAASLPVGEWFAAAVTWIGEHGMIAWLAFIGTYVLATVLVVPGSILTLAGGFIFGLPLGVALVSAGSVLGAAAAFLIGRFLARAWVAERIGSLPRFHALDVATRRDGFMIVLLARLSPLFPFNLLNYGLGLTAVPFKAYVVASWLGMLPVTVLYVYVGSLAKDLTDLTRGDVDNGWLTVAFLAVGLVATAVLTVLVTRRANQVLRERLQEPDARASTSADSGVAP